jgi:hypothetical protein
VQRKIYVYFSAWLAAVKETKLKDVQNHILFIFALKARAIVKNPRWQIWSVWVMIDEKLCTFSKTYATMLFSRHVVNTSRACQTIMCFHTSRIKIKHEAHALQSTCF